jgi:hypothetical protein
MNMPKSQVGRILNMVGCYIDPPEHAELNNISEETLLKYEYIDLFRKDFR